MYSNLIVARMDPRSSAEVAELFSAFDKTDLPHRMGTRRRQLFSFHGLYFHLQDFETEDGGERIQNSEDLKPFIEAYDPATWRSPADAMAKRFYNWESA